MTLGTMPLADLLADHVAELELVDALTVTPWREVSTPAQEHARAERQREATRQALAILDRERRGVAERPPFRGPLQALRAIDEVLLDGAPIKSTSDPARFECAGWMLSSTGGGDGAQRARERIAFARREWEACFADGWTISTSPVVLRLSAAQAREVVVAAVLGIPGDCVPVQGQTALRGEGVRQPPTPGHALRRLAVRGAVDDRGVFARDREPKPAEIAAHLGGQFGVELPVGHVVRLRRAGVVEFYGRLVTRGLVPHDERMATMAVTTTTPYDIEGWKDIASALGCSVSLAQKVAERDENPAPVYLSLRGVVAVRAELAEWLRKDLRPYASTRTGTR